MLKWAGKSLFLSQNRRLIDDKNRVFSLKRGFRRVLSEGWGAVRLQLI